MRILAFATDLIPLPGLPTSGTALRTLGLVEGLCSHGHEALVSVPKTSLLNLEKNLDISSLSKQTNDALSQLKKLAFDSSNQAAIIAQTNPDVIICGHWPAMTLPKKPSQTVIIDLAGPHLLERHYQDMPNQTGAIYAKLNNICKADYFIVSGASQRLYFLSFLLRAKVSNPEKRIVTIAMPLDPRQPKRKDIDYGAYPRFVFGGIFLPWQDPSTALELLSTELESSNTGSLTLIGGKHPNYEINEGVYSTLFEKLSKNPRVIRKPMMPYNSFISELSNMDVAIDLMKWNLERELAVTIRSTTYLWSGVPVIYNNYADLSQLISKYDAGWCISPDDKDGLRNIIKEIIAAPALVHTKSYNALRLSREVFAWDRAVRPLLDILGSSKNQAVDETDITLDFPSSDTLKLSSNEISEQLFLCRIDGLSKVECHFAELDKQSTSSHIRMSIYEINTHTSASHAEAYQSKKTLIKAKKICGQELKENSWLSIGFEAREHSAGNIYMLMIEEIGKNSLALPYILRGSPYPMLGLYHQGKYLKHSALCLRTICSKTN